MITLRHFSLSFLLLFMMGHSFGRQAVNSPSNSFIQDDPSISLHLDEVAFDEFISALNKQTGYTFYYDPRWIHDVAVSLDVDSQPLSQVLESVLSPHHLFASRVKKGQVFITQSAPISTRLAGRGSDTAGIRPSSRLANHLIGDYVDTVRQSNLTLENRIFQFGNPHSAGSGEKILSGYIRSINTGEPITQATIRVVDGHISVQPDQNGFYSISLPPGSATLQVSSVGKSDAQRQLLMYDHGRLDIELDDVVYALSEVVVSAEKGQNLQRTAMGVERISVQTIRQTPAVLGEADVVKVVLSMPGVQTVSEASGGFNVRGGATDQNLVLFSDATVFNPSHFFGFFSSFNADVVNDVELYKSSIPARYGGRLSSVLNISAKSGTKNKITGAGGIGLLTGRLSLEGPIGEHSTFVVGGRSTYSDWLLDLLPNDDYKNSAAGFYDVNLYFTSQLTEKDALYVMGYFSNDRFKLRTDTTYQYQNQNFNLKWNRIHSNNLYSVLTVGYDGYSNGIQGRGNEFHAFDWDYGLEQIFGRLDISHRINHKHNLTYGLQSNYFQSQPGIVQPTHSGSILLPDQLQGEQALETSLHIDDNITLNEKIGLDLGLRYTLYQFLGPHTQRNYEPNVPVSEGSLVNTKEIQAGKTGKLYHGPEFRVGMRYTLSPASSLKLGYNSMNQYIHMLSNTTSITPTDTWKLSDSNIKPQRGDQVAAGYYHNFRDDAIETSVEVYYKRMHDYLDYKSGATLVMNHRIEQDIVPTEARAYGLEFLLRKNTGKLNGWISYAYARVEQRTNSEFWEEMINHGAYYPSNHDKPHSFNLVGNYRVSHRFSVSVNSQYSTGRPITLPIGKFNYAGGTRVIYSDRNQYRIPDYFRVDLSLNIEGNHKVRKLAHSSWSVGVYNLTGRENPFSVYFLSEGQALNGYKLSVFGSQIPFVTYNFKF